MSSNPTTPALKLRGEAAFDHEGETRKVALDVLVMMAVEAETGIGLLGMHRGVASLHVSASILRHGLAKGAGLDVTLAQSAEMLMTNDGAHKAVIAAFEGFLPEPPKVADAGDDAENPIDAAGNGVGTKA